MTELKSDGKLTKEQFDNKMRQLETEKVQLSVKEQTLRETLTIY